jgi:cysteine desulfurase
VNVNKPVYLDHNATTPMDPKVLEEMSACLTERFGNPSSIHFYGQEAKAALYDARERLATLLNARTNEVHFTSGGTEADNLAILGVLEAAEGGRRHLVTSSVEHHALLNPMKALMKKGWPVTFLKVDRAGVVDPGDLERALTSETLLVSVMHANNETGVIQPVAQLARLSREAGAYFHTDAVQSVGKIPVDVEALGVDLLSLAGHKMYGPKGSGTLFVRRGVKFRPVLRGGGQERSRRPGTENLPAIVGLGCAAELAQGRIEADGQRIRALRDLLESQVKERIRGVLVNGEGAERTPNTSNLSFDGVEGETLAIALDLQGFAVSTGAACSSGTIEPSHVLIAMGLRPERVQSSIRVSLGRDTTQEDILAFVSTLHSAVESVRRDVTAYTVRR